MKDDKILIAGIIGALCTIPSEIVTYILVKLGVGINSIYSISSMIITINRPKLLMGFFISSAVGGITSCIFFIFLQKYGFQHITVKCIGLSLFLWICLELVFTFAIEGRFISIRPINDYYVHLVGGVTYGLFQGMSFKKFLT